MGAARRPDVCVFWRFGPCSSAGANQPLAHWQALLAHLENKFFARAVPVYLAIAGHAEPLFLQQPPSECSRELQTRPVGRPRRLRPATRLCLGPCSPLPAAQARVPEAALASVALVTITTGITCLNAVFPCENCLPWPEALNRRSHPAWQLIGQSDCCISVWMFLADTTKAAGALCNVYGVARLRTP